MASFPTLSTGSIGMYPLTWTKSTSTTVHHFDNDAEQRYRNRKELNKFELQFSNIGEADYGLIEAFYDARRGEFDATWDITINGTLVSNLTFDGDTLTLTQSKHGYVSFTLRVRQTK